MKIKDVKHWKTEKRNGNRNEMRKNQRMRKILKLKQKKLIVGDKNNKKKKNHRERSANEIFRAEKWRRRKFFSPRVGHKPGKEIAPFGETLHYKGVCLCLFFTISHKAVFRKNPIGNVCNKFIN